MRVASLLVVVALTFPGTGCKETPREQPPAAADRTSGSEVGEPHEPTSESSLRVAPELLHDLRLTTAAAQARASAEGVTALGELRVNEDTYAEVGTPVVARIVKVLAGVGDAVAAGQPLVELSSVEMGKAIADYRRARARAQLAKQVLKRKRDLAAERIVPQRELQDAEGDSQAAAAELEAAQAGLRAFGVSEEDAQRTDTSTAELVLRAPIAGTVIDRDAVRGQMAEPATPLVRIADLSRLWLIAHVFERDAVRIESGSAARTSFPAIPGRTFAGVVTSVGQQVDSKSRTIPVRIEVANDEGMLRPGMSSTAWIPLAAAGGAIVTVPASALQPRENGWCVFIPGDAGTFEMRSVGRGRDLGGEVEVVNGLAAGETVVVDGAFLLNAEAHRARGEGEQHEH